MDATPTVADAHLVGDPAADEVIDALVAAHGSVAGVELLDRFLRDPAIPDDLPPVLAAFVADHSVLPRWADAGLLAEGRRVFETYGWTTFCLLALASLPEGYSVGEVDRVLATTQQLEHHVNRRLWETLQFTLDVLSGDGIEGPAGVRAVVKVRLMHALMRHLITTPAPSSADDAGGLPAGLGRTLLEVRWRPDDDLPINQAQMAGTVLAFSFVTLRGLRQLGYELSEHEERAYLHSWNVVGHLLGVERSLLVDTFDEAFLRYHELRDPRLEVTEEGRRLTAALLTFVEDQVPFWLFFLRPLPAMLVWFFVGEQVASSLGVDLSAGQRRAQRPLALVMVAWGRARSAVLRRWAPARLATRWLFRRLGSSLLGRPRGGRRGAFTVDPALLERWGLRASGARR